MEPMKEPRSAATPPHHVTPAQFEEFYIAEYSRLVKLLGIVDATIEEAEDAAQKAMMDFFRRCNAGEAFSNGVAYVYRAAMRFFVKERQRDRERQPREIKGGHLTLPALLDDQLTACEDEQWVEHVLESLTPAQRDVFRLIMCGLSTREIAGQLDKSNATIRQHLKNGRDRLLEHPEIAPRAPLSLTPGTLARGSEIGGDVGSEEGGDQ
jgi:RNA polymerase sigma factor (sigma-70 family)